MRRRPGMYIGSTDHRGLHHLIYEIVDNAVDEAMAGYCDSVTIQIHPDGSVQVEDNGRGIPVDIHPTTGKSAVETVMTTLHAGGKFGGKGYTVSGGLHGVGASVVNALSSWLRVEVRRDGYLYAQDFQRGQAMGPLERVTEALGNGTVVTFLPDEEIFGSPEYNFDDLCQRFKEMAYLNKGLKIHLTSNWHKEQGYSEWEQEYQFDGGIVQLCQPSEPQQRGAADTTHVRCSRLWRAPWWRRPSSTTRASRSSPTPSPTASTLPTAGPISQVSAQP